MPTLAPIVPLAFALLAALAFLPGLVGGEAPVFRDLLVLTIPLRHLAATDVAAGHVPLWNPLHFFGAPFFANWQSAVFYPPSVALYVLPFPLALSLLLAFHVGVAATGMAWLLARFEDLPSRAAFVGGVVFGFGGFLFSLVPLTNQLQAAAWLPWLAGAAMRFQATGSRPAATAVVVLLAFQALTGAPETLVISVVVAGACALRERPRNPTPSTRLVAFPVLGLLAAGLCAFQLLPTAEYVFATDRMGGLGVETMMKESLEPRSFLQLVLPPRFRDGGPEFLPVAGVPLFWSLYPGVAALALVAGGLASRRSLFWIALGIPSCLLALGPHTPLLPWLHGVAPDLVGMFRFPGKLFLPCHFALAALAAEGAAVAFRRRAIPVGIAMALALAGAGLLFHAILLSHPEATIRALFAHPFPPETAEATFAWLADNLASTALRSSALALAATILLGLVAARRLRDTLAVPVLGLLIAGDLLLVHVPMLVFTPWQDLRQLARPEAFGIAAGERVLHYCTDARCVAPGAPGIGPWSGRLRPGENAEVQARRLAIDLVPDLPWLDGVGAVSGSDGLRTLDQADLFGALALRPTTDGVRILAALGVDHLIGADPLPAPSDLPFRTTPTGSRVYTLPDAAARTYVASRVWRARTPAEAFEILADADFRPGEDVVVADDPSRPLVSTGGRVGDATYADEEIRATLELDGEGLWVVGDTWFEGWSATVDGRPAPIVRANAIQRAVPVPAGRHEVVMRYEPTSFQAGLALTAATFALALFLLWLGRRR